MLCYTCLMIKGNYQSVYDNDMEVFVYFLLDNGSVALIRNNIGKRSIMRERK